MTSTTAEIAFTMTNKTIVVVHGGKNHMIKQGDKNFIALRQALLAEDWDAARQRLSVPDAVNSWAKGKFKLSGDDVIFDGEKVPSGIRDRILEMAAKGEDAESICKFWARLKLNPSYRSVEQLWSFLKNAGIPITKEGTFLAYKAVDRNYMDFHSHTLKNSIGTTIEMPRNKISDDPKEACHYGLHVGALSYASSFGDSDRRVVVCEISPEDVVCVPYDSSQQKMRVCKYKVIGNNTGELLSSTYTEDVPDIDSDEDTIPVDSEPIQLTSDMEVKKIDEGTKVTAPKRSAGVPKKFARIHKLSTNELFEETTEKLREYASHGLKMVGVSKIPGGKLALISAISKVR